MKSVTENGYVDWAAILEASSPSVTYFLDSSVKCTGNNNNNSNNNNNNNNSNNNNNNNNNIHEKITRF